MVRWDLPHSYCGGIRAPRGAFYLKFGLGRMSYEAQAPVLDLTATAPRGSFGLGCEIRVGRNVSIVPF